MTPDLRPERAIGEKARGAGGLEFGESVQNDITCKGPTEGGMLFGIQTSKIKKAHLLFGAALRLGTRWSPCRAKHSGKRQSAGVLSPGPSWTSVFRL